MKTVLRLILVLFMLCAPGAARAQVCGTISPWSPHTAAEANAWIGLTYGNGLFVAVTNGGTNRIMTSPDGITWTARAAPEANGWASVTYGNGLFVSVANSGTNRVMTSPDGITWTPRAAAAANGWVSVAYGNGLFVAVANNSGGATRVMTSPDGINWTLRTASETSGWRSVTYGNGQYVAVSQAGTNRVMTSPDGIVWTSQTASEAAGWISITYGNGLYVAVADSGTNRVMTSPDGITWTGRTVDANQWLYVTYGVGMFVAVASSGTNRVMVSADGITWTPQAATAANLWTKVIYGDGKFVAISQSGTDRVMTAECIATLDCSDPDGSESDMVYNQDHRVIQYCDGADWVAMHAKGSGSGGCATSTMGLRSEGALFYNYDHRVMQACAGNVWKSMGPSKDRDDLPDMFGFFDQTDTALNTLILSNIVTINGVSPGTSVSIAGVGTPQIRINGGGWVTSGTINNGQTLQLRLTSANADTTMRSATVTVGSGSDQWDVTTNDNSPTGLAFTDVTAQALNTLITSNSVTVNGISGTVAVSVSGAGSPQIRVNGGSWTAGPTTITNGQTLEVRLTSANADVTMRSATVTVGSGSDQWDVTTNDNAPTAFNFTDVTGQALNTLITSNSVTISGITGTVNVSVSGAGSPEIRVNGGSWTAGPTTITNGQTLEVRLTSNASGGVMNSATVSVGSGNDIWSVTTDPCAGSPAIGTYCSDGTIFAGDTNLYIAIVDQVSESPGPGIRWHTSVGADHINPDSSTDGRVNRNNILQPIANYPSIQLCDNLVLNGYSDWYLPAINELLLIHTNKTAIETTAVANGGQAFSTAATWGFYWSSTEHDNFGGKGVNFAQAPHSSNHAKNFQYSARCVRRKI